MPYYRKKPVFRKRNFKKRKYVRPTVMRNIARRNIYPANNQRNTKILSTASGAPFPKRLWATLNYAQIDKIGIIGAASWEGLHQFKLSSLFAPDVTGASGNQPRFFDTLCGADNGTAPYRGYTVVGAKVILQIINGSGNALQLAVGARKDSTNAPTSGREYAERQNYSLINLSKGGNHDVQTIKRYYNMYKMIPGRDVAADTSSTVYNASPAAGNNVMFEYDIYNLNGATVANSIIVTTKIKFYVRFNALNDVQDS